MQIISLFRLGRGLFCKSSLNPSFSLGIYARFLSTSQFKDFLNNIRLNHRQPYHDHELVSYVKEISCDLSNVPLSTLSNPSIVGCLPRLNLKNCKQTHEDLSSHLRSIVDRSERSKVASIVLLVYAKDNSKLVSGFINTLKKNNVFVDSDVFVPVIVWSLKRKDFDKSKRFLTEMTSIMELPFKDSNLDIVINTCTRMRAENYDEVTEFTKECFEIIGDYGRNDLNKPLLDAIFSWFKSDPKVTWKLIRTNMSSKGLCKKCSNHLEQIYPIPPQNLQNLEKKLLNNLKPAFKKNLQEFDFFHQYLKESGPFDLVIDSLNLGYTDEGFNPKLFRSKIDLFLKQKKKILVICAGPLRDRMNSKEDIQELFGYLENCCSLFFLQSYRVDDHYLLYTLIFHKFNIKIVSNDIFRDKIYKLDKECSSDFIRWQKANQYHFYRDKGLDGKPVLFPNYEYHIGMQRHKHGWHIPISRLWYCISKMS